MNNANLLCNDSKSLDGAVPYCLFFFSSASKEIPKPLPSYFFVVEINNPVAKITCHFVTLITGKKETGVGLDAMQL